MKRSRIERKTPIARGGPIRKKKRTAAETKRIYGEPGRVEFVKTLRCEGCGAHPAFADPRSWRIVSAHIVTGGTGRKSDAEKIIPLCETVARNGCHDLQHKDGWSALASLATKEQREAAAARTEAAWQSYVRSRQGRRSA